MAITVQMRTEVSQLYVALFGRAPDGEGLGYWTQLRDQGQSLAQIANTMYATAPARTYYPTFLTNGEIVSAFYVNVLGRSADAEGLAFWTGKLNAAGATPGSVIAEMINVVANYSGADAAGVTSKNLYNNKVAVAQYYGEKNGNVAGASNVLATVTADAATVTTAKAAIDSGSVGNTNQGNTFTLTNAIDNFTGTAGNDTFIGDNAFTTAADQINGGAGTDTFRWFGNGTAAPQMTSIEQIDLVNSANDISLTGVSGLTQVALEGNVTAARTITVGANVTNVIRNVTDAGNALTFTNSATQTSANVVVSGSTNVGTLNIDGAAIASLAIQSTGSANNKVATLASTGNEATLTITGDKGLTITNALAATVATVNASALTGALSVDVSAATGTALTNLKVTGGTGNDTVKLGAMTIGVSAAFDGGAGTDTIQITDGSKITATTGKQITNFETLATGAGTGAYDASLIAGITGFTVDGNLAGNTSITNLPAAPTVSITANQTGAETLTIALKDATGTSDSVTVNVGGAADVTASGKIITTAIETVNVSSTKTAANASTTGNTVTDLDVTGAKTINVNAAYKLTLTTSNSGAVTKLDASASTEGVVMTAALGAQATQLLGGAGADTLIGGSTAATGDTFKGGKGGDTITLAAAGKGDVVIYSAATDSVIASGSVTGMDTIGNTFTINEDKIDVTAFAFAGFGRGVKSVGAITNAETTLTRAGFFDVAGSNRGVAAATEGGNTYVFVDVDKDGAFNAANDLVIKMTGVPALTSTDFLF